MIGRWLGESVKWFASGFVLQMTCSWRLANKMGGPDQTFFTVSCRYIWGSVWHPLKNGHVAGRNGREDEGEGKTWRLTAACWYKNTKKTCCCLCVSGLLEVTFVFFIFMFYFSHSNCTVICVCIIFISHLLTMYLVSFQLLTTVINLFLKTTKNYIQGNSFIQRVLYIVLFIIK